MRYDKEYYAEHKDELNAKRRAKHSIYYKPELRKAQYEKHGEDVRAKERARYYKKHGVTGPYQRPRANKLSEEELRERRKARQRKRYLEHPNYQRDRMAALRKRALDILGHKCAVCGFDDERALQIDHKNGGGNKEIKSLGSNEAVLRRVIEVNGEGYQTLCANHNWIKRVERGEVRNGSPNT